MRAVTRYRGQNLSFAHPDHLCFDRTTYDNINGPGGPFTLDIIGPAGPLMYPDQISRDSHEFARVHKHARVGSQVKGLNTRVLIEVNEKKAIRSRVGTREHQVGNELYRTYLPTKMATITWR